MFKRVLVLKHLKRCQLHFFAPAANPLLFLFLLLLLLMLFYWTVSCLRWMVIQLLLRCKGEVLKVQFIAVTGCSLEADLQRCISCGYNSYLVKPVGRERLLQELLQQLEKWSELATLLSCPGSFVVLITHFNFVIQSLRRFLFTSN